MLFSALMKRTFVVNHNKDISKDIISIDEYFNRYSGLVTYFE